MAGIRLFGMGSGLDIDNIVSQMMKTERVRYDQVKAKRQTLLWKQDLYREMNTSLSSMQSTLDKMRLDSHWLKFSMSSTNDQAVSATNSGVTNSASHTISVKNLAKSAKLTGQAINNPASVQPLKGKLNVDTDGKITIPSGSETMTVKLGEESKTIKIEAKTYSNADELQTAIQEKINQAFGAGKVQVGIDDQGGTSYLTMEPVSGKASSLDAPQLRVIGSDTSLMGQLGFFADDPQVNKFYKLDADMSIEEFQKRLGMTAAEDMKLTINGVKIEVPLKNSDGVYNTVQTLMDEVNRSSAGVKMTYDTFSQSFSFLNKSTGSNSFVNLESNMTEDMLAKMGFPETLGSGDSGRKAQGEDAEFYLDGVLTWRNTNTFTDDGITYTLKKETYPDTTTISAQWDTEAVFKQVKEFVDKYNEMIEKINGKLGEKINRDFKPLTDEQKKDMKDKEIEMWEEKAKSGILRNDTYLSSAMHDMRLALYETVKDLPGFGQLTQLGITTSNNYKDNGKLVIQDEEKVKKAIAEDPSGIAKLFAQKPSSPAIPYDPNNPAPYQERERLRYQESGLVTRLNERLKKAIEDVQLRIDNKGYETDSDTSIAKELKSIDKRLKTLDAMLKEKENSYYKRFTVLEKQMSRLNSQSNWLSSQLGMGR